MLTTSKSLTAEQRIERSHIELMKHPHFVAYSGVLMVGSVKVKEADECPTAYTNGRDVVYGRDFLAKLDDADVRGLILHENKHKMYRHLATWQHLHKINPQKANKACDYVINLEIDDEGKRTGGFVSVPEGGLLDEQYRGFNAQEVFHKLQDDDEDGSGGSGGLDEHGWEEAQEMSAEEAEESAKEIETALRQGAILAGKMKGEVSREIQELLTPKVDWKEALRDFIKTTMQGKDQTTWRRLHKRYIGLDIIMPSTYSEQIGSIVVAIDTSGSIGQEELSQFLSEVKLICDEVTPESLDLLYWDTEVASHETYRGHELSTVTDVTQAKGGGGTSPECVPKYMHKNNMSAECLIMLTDGHINRQKDKDWNVISPMPIMWCVKGNSRFDSNSVQGKVVHVE